MRIIRERPVATCVAWATDMLCLPFLLHSLVDPSNIAGKFWVRANWTKETKKSVADIQLFLLQLSPSFNPLGLTISHQQKIIPSQQLIPLYGAVKTHPYILNNLRRKYTCPLPSIREIVFVTMIMSIRWKVQHPISRCLYIYPSSERRNVPITVVDCRLQYDFQLCCDPAYSEKSESQIEHTRTYSPQIACFLQRLDSKLNTVLILTSKIFQSKIDVYREKSSNS